MLLCHKDSYLRTLTTKVVSCTAMESGYGVVLEETIFYPEGGGQPSDHGTIAGQPVKAVMHGEKSDVIHVVEKPIDGEVPVAIDWLRRYDHMQQHTAQHLLTAVAHDRFKLATTAFHLGMERSDIEVNAAQVAPSALRHIEEIVNEFIREDLPVSWREVEPESIETLKIRTRGLPEGFSGTVRLVEIRGIDLNTCGGTHVGRTAELQVVKIISTEQLRGGTRIFFLAGGRVLHSLETTLEHERALTRLLSCGRDEHEVAVKRLADEVKRGARAQRDLRIELARYLGEALTRADRVNALHRADGDMDFLRAIAEAASACRSDMLILLTGGGEKGPGVFLLKGPANEVQKIGPSIAGILEGRGGGTGTIFQGKANSIEKRGEALSFLGTAAISGASTIHR